MTQQGQTSSAAHNMRPATLGRGGPLVSPLGLGTMTFGAETDETVSHQQLDTYVDHGGTFIDTADVYGSGESERIVGRWIHQRGGIDDLVLSTKGRFAPPFGSHGASRRSLIRSVDASLQRLQVEAIDVYFVHGWDPYTPIVDTLNALESLVQSGKIHDVGWSNVTGWQLQQIISTAQHNGLPMPVAVQPQYNLLDRGIELEVLPCCLDAGISLTPWSPLGGGWLTGKYQRDKRPEGNSRLGDDPERGVEAYDVRNNDRTFRILDVQSAIAKRLDCPPAHVALAWLLSRPAVTSVLLGARTLAQLNDNLAAKDLILDADAIVALSKVSAPGLPPYPYEFVQDWCSVDVWQRLATADR
ncbi:MAG: aldo/keto reductase [Granulosicoccus sp.]